MTTNNNIINNKKEIKEIEIENKEIYELFNNNSANQLESNMFLERKKLLNAQKGESEINDMLKMKLKGLDMFNSILLSNKKILETFDLNYSEVLIDLLNFSRCNKNLYENILKKIKSISIFLLKNQILIKNKNENSILSIIKFIIILLNSKYEYSYFQQIYSVIIKEENILQIFIENFLDKFFKGRNLNLKINDVKNIFKLFLVNKNNYKCLNFFNLFINLLKFVELKGEGSRTIHQVNQDLVLLQYSLDFINNKKLNENIIKNEKNFNEKINKIYDKINDLLNNMINENDYNKDVEELKKFSDENNFLGAFRTSALNGYNIENGINFLVDEIINKIEKEEEENKKMNKIENGGRKSIKLNEIKESNNNKKNKCC
jgi:hypothetical protein